jgi:acyl transferase domain-containing protein/thioesterase domain-containing protein/acyl carrier protein
MHNNDNDIAIVGIALRVPGAATPEQFWSNLAGGVESVQTYTDDELLARGVSPDELANPNYVRAGIPLEDVDQFDPEFFGFSPKEAAILDPQHRHFYEVAWEALERAGHPPAKFDGAIGVFAGCGMGAYFTFNLLTNPDLVDTVGLFLLRHTGNDKDFLATRVSYAFNLKGPSVNVVTACSTSLVATHLAVQSLLSGECDMALAGGSTIEIPHRVGYIYKEGEVLSPDGHCRTFDHRSKGTVFGSGTGVVVLRRLADALADGDHVHAVIKGSAVNNDGASKVGYLAPSVDGQAAAIAEALAVADVPADSIGYVECHGTATPVGDPIELAALTRAFRESTSKTGYCRIGSVKTNIGHLDTAAGVASLIKATLALEHGQIPPSLNYEAPNPVIDFASSPFKVAASLTDWQKGSAPRRACVNSLGVGGTNAFVVLEEAPTPAPRTQEPKPQLLALSARNRRALDDASKRLAKWLRENHDQPLGDIAYTLRVGRDGFEQRRVLAATTHDEAAALLESGDPRRVFTHVHDVEHPSLVFMYPGGGAQYFKMGRGLYDSEPVFREHVDRGLAILKTRFKTDLAPIFFAPDTQRDDISKVLAQPAIQLPLTFIVEYALTKLWEEYGVKPDALIGHSMGENTAACVAGVFSFEDALGLLLLRGQLVEQAPPGGMLSVPMPAAELRKLIGDDLDIAASNSPALSVASGTRAALDKLAERLTQERVEWQHVKVSVAAHSRLLNGILEQFRAYLASIELHEPQIPIVSNRTGKWLDAAQARDPSYWAEHLRNTVLFSEGIETLLEGQDRALLEVGPGNMLSSFARQHPSAPAQRVLASMRHPEDTAGDDAYFRAAAGRLWAVGIEPDLEKLHPGEHRRIPLPTYAFQHARYWVEPTADTVTARKPVNRPVRLADTKDWLFEPRWVQQGLLVEPIEVKSKWLVFDAGDPIVTALVARLREHGHTVVTVIAADAYARLDAHRYSIAPEAAGAGYQELLEELAANDLFPDRVLHGWLLTRDRSFRPGSSFLHRNQEYGFYSLFHLARALGKADTEGRSLHCLVLSNGMARVATEAVPYPDKATVLGPCAVIPREFPNITCAVIDLELAEATGAKQKKNGNGGAHVDAAVIDRLEAELWAAPATSVVAWRGDVRWQRHVVRARSTARSAPLQDKLRQRGVYLITGGLGGIGGEIATWLAKEYRARLILIGRTPLPAREDWDHWLAQHESSDTISRAITKIHELESLGAEVLAVAADVTVADTMQQAVAEARAAFGEINGVFHAAGVIRDNLIQLKSQRDIEEVFSAKVYGTLVLDELFRKQPLDFMVLFSSTSAFVAPQGQVDYVGASAFVNAFAESCQGARPYPVTAIAWGIWRDVGMAAPPRPLSTAASLDDAMAHATLVPTSYPLFETHHASREGLVEQHVFAGSLSAERDWVIDEHRLGSGEALLPGTGYIELVRAALAEIGQTGPWELGNLVFQNPLFVANGAPRDYRVRLRGDGRRFDVSVFARRSADGWEECASAKVSTAVRAAPARLALGEADTRIEGTSTSAAGSGRLRSRQEDHLKFGPRWQVLTQLKVGSSEAIAHLKLPDAHTGDVDTYGLHPGLLDIATGYAMDLIPGYGDQEVPENLWVPISYRALRFYRPLPAEIASSVRINKRSSVESGFAAFDVLITDTQGEPLVEVEGLTLRRTDGALRAPAAEAAQGAEGQPLAPPPKPLSPAEEALKHNVTQGITVRDGLAVLHGILSRPMPATVIASSMNVADLLAQADALSQTTSRSGDTRFARPELDSDFEAPRDEIEKSLADLWGKLLGVEGVGIKDSFFDLGGHSLIAVRLFNEIADRWGMDLPMSVLMQSPNIASLAELIRGSAHVEGSAGSAPAQSDAAAAPALRFRHVVPMHTGSVAGGTPLFVVAGMFGNVLNLSHLAHLLGEDRPFYALQARGLYGDAEPHETFEEMAADYLAELREVQPHGPYLLGGFSGGGLIAFEMARRLIEQGERVLTVLMLDTPVRVPYRFTLGERVSMLAQDVRAKGPTFFADKIRQRIEWQREQRERASRADPSAADAVHFQSRRIGDAFMRALFRYKVPKVDVNVAVFRPKLHVRYRLSRGRMVDGERNFVSPDNFWTPHVGKLSVFEVPGNHDSMVLEPNVRVLVSQMKRVIDQVEHAPAVSRAKAETAARPAREVRDEVVANALS